MPWRHVLRALILPAAGCLLNLGVFAFSRASGRFESPTGLYVGVVTVAVAAACAIALVALPAGLAVMLRAARLIREGRVPVFSAVRFTYRVARTVHAAVAVGDTMTFATPFVLLFAPDWLPLVLALAVVAGAGFLMHLLSSGPGEAREPLPLTGRVFALDDVAALQALAEPTVRKVGATLPRHVIVGLAPGVYCLQRDVAVNSDVLEGGALYLSLPMCRVLDRGELAGLVAFEIAREHAYGEGRQQSIEDARARVTHLLSHRPTASPAREAFAGAFLPLQLWGEMMGGLDLAIWREAIQEGAVAAGRETMASAITIHFLCEPVWEPYFRDLQQDLRGEAFGRSRVENLSEQLALRCRALVDEPGFRRALDSIEALHAAHPLLGLLVGSLGVAPSDVAARLRGLPGDPAIDMIPGSAEIERELSVTALKELCPEWPRLRASAPGAPTVEPAQRPTAPWRPPDTLSGTPTPHPDQRPMFTEVGKRWAAEGLLLGLLFVLAVLSTVWNLATLAPRVELGNLRTGPQAFPISVYIDGDNVSFTNRSGERWECAVELGADAARAFTATFAVNGLETCHVPYQTFRGPTRGAPDADVRDAAYKKGLVTCVQRSGQTRVWGW